MKDHITSSENKLESVFDVVNALQMCISKLKEKYPDANVIIQGDFNTYPEYFNSDLTPEISEKIERLNIFSHLEQKQDLEVYRTDKPTELNRQVHELQERELDYVLASKSLKGRVHMFEPDDQELSLANLRKIQSTLIQCSFFQITDHCGQKFQAKKTTKKTLRSFLPQK